MAGFSPDVIYQMIKGKKEGRTLQGKGKEFPSYDQRRRRFPAWSLTAKDIMKKKSSYDLGAQKRRNRSGFVF